MISGGCTQLTLFYNMLHCQILPPPPKVYSWGVGSLMRKAFPEVKFSLVFTSFHKQTEFDVGCV